MRSMKPLLLALPLGFRKNSLLAQHIKETKKALIKNNILPTLDGRLIKLRDRKYLINDDNSSLCPDKNMRNRHLYYLCRLIDSGISRGEIFVLNSLENRGFDDYLVNDDVWNEREKHLSDAGLDWMIDEPEDHLMCLEKTLENQLTLVGQRISKGKNTYIKREGDSDKLRWSKAVIAKDNELTEKFFVHFNRESIVN